MPGLLEVKDLSVSLATPRGSVRALTDVSFDLSPGETLGLVGESGSGKTILGRTLMHLLPPIASLGSNSSANFNGRNLFHLTPTEQQHFWGPQIAMVFQDPMTSLNPVRSVGAQVMDPLRFHLGLSRTAARNRAEELLKHVGLEDVSRRMRQFPHELSGGMRQRVMIAIAVSCSPRLLIADEPTTALDVTVQKQVLDLLRRLQAEEDMAIILISHDLGLVTEYTRRVAVMYAGHLVEVAPSQTLAAMARHRYTSALLRSTPSLSMVPHQRIDAIEGRPPELVGDIAGCPFASRCASASSICLEVYPTETRVGDDSRFWCHHPCEPAPSSGADARSRGNTERTS